MKYSATVKNKLQEHAVVSGEGHRNTLQYSCLENPVDRRAWWAAVHRVEWRWTQLKQLSMHACVGEGNGNSLQYSCLENPRDRGAWWAAVYGVAQSWTQLKRLSSSSSSLWNNVPGNSIALTEFRSGILRHFLLFWKRCIANSLINEWILHLSHTHSKRNNLLWFD